MIRILILLFIPLIVYGQNVKISGTIYNAVSDQPIEGAQIIVDNTLETFSNQNGEFKLRVGRIGRCKIHVTAEGYFAYDDNGLLLRPGLLNNLEIQLNLINSKVSRAAN